MATPNPNNPEYQQQHPYVQPPTSPSAHVGVQAQPGTQINPVTLTTVKHWGGYLVAGIGGIVALLAFFAMPYFAAASYGFFSAYSYSFTGSQLASFRGAPFMLNLLWLVPVLAALAIGVSALVALSIKATDVQSLRVGASIVLGSGIACVALLVIEYFYINSSLGNYGSSSSPFGFGFWLTLLAAVAIAIGGFLKFREVRQAMLKHI